MDLSPLSKAIPSWGSPTLEGFDMSNVQDGQRLRGSARQFVRFYSKTVAEPYATEVRTNEKTGEVKVLKSAVRNIEREMVEIITPGDKNSVDDYATDWHKREHWQAYKAFRNGNSAPIGVPIDECSFVSSGVATELKYLGVQTREQLADASDDLCNNIADGWQLREFARAMCAADKGGKVNQDVALLKSELREAKEMIAQLIANQNMSLKDPVLPQKRKAGRPAKIQEEISNEEVTS